MIQVPKSQYEQVADVLRQRIEDGTYPAGTLLPSEDRIAEELEVSRVTINRAVTILRSSGHVKVHRGVGTLVRSQTKIIRNSRERHTSTAADAQKPGTKSPTVYVEVGKTTAPPEVAKALGLTKTKDVLLRNRVLYADKEPSQIANSYLPWTLVKDVPDLLEEYAGEGGSDARLRDAGMAPVKFTEDVTVRMPTTQEAKRLGLEQAQPIFEIFSVAYIKDGTPIEVTVQVMSCRLWTLHHEWTSK